MSQGGSGGDPREARSGAELAIADLVAPNLAVLFCGINPGMVSGATGLHFARPGNRFWKVLCAAGFTDRVLAPPEQVQLLASGIGITNLVDRATTGAADLSSAELRAGADVLEDKVRALSPKVVAFLGMQAYRLAFRRPRAAVGLQGETLGPASVWLLPNPSGLQARYQLPELVTMFGELHRFAMAG